MGKQDKILTKETIWKTNLYAMWLSQFCVNMGYGLAIPFIPYFLEEMAVLTADQLSFYTGLSSSIPAAAMAIASPFWGNMSDKYGRKNMLIRALVCSTIVLVCLGLSKTVFIFLMFRAVQGFFTGSVPASMALISANTPDKNLSQAIGFMTSSSFLGYAVGPVLGGFVCEWLSYSACFIIGSVINTIGLFFVLFFIKEIPGTYGVHLVEERKRKKKEQGGSGVLSMGIVMILIIMLCMRLARTVFAPFLALYVREVLGTMDGATTYVGILNAATCVSTAVASVTLARLGDRFDKFNFAGVLTVLAFIVTVVLSSGLPIWPFIVCYGAFYFLVGGIEPVLTSAASEIVDESSLGVLFGLLNTVSSLGMMLSPLAGSAVSVIAGIRSIPIVMPVFIFLEGISTVVMIVYVRKKRRMENA